MANFSSIRPGFGGLHSGHGLGGFSTLESDDAFDLRSQSIRSGRYDSGIASLPEGFSLKSGGFPSIGGAAATTGAEAAAAAAAAAGMLAYQLGDLALSDDATAYRSGEWPSVRNYAAVRSACKPEVPEASFAESKDDDPAAGHWSIRNTSIPQISPFEQDEDGDTQLHLAIIRPDPSAAIRLIESVQFTNLLDIHNDHQQTPLHLAVIVDQPQVVRALVLSGASLLARDRIGNTALHLACKLGHVDCVRRLVSPPSDEELQYVWMERQRRCLPANWPTTYMTQADISLLNYEGDTCLHLTLSSSAQTKFEILNFLVNTCCADINVQEGKCGFSLLHQSVRSKDTAAVQFLLAQPTVMINQPCYNGYTALDVAFGLHLPHLADLLQCFGATAYSTDGGSFPESDASQDDFDDLMIAGQCAAVGVSMSMAPTLRR